MDQISTSDRSTEDQEWITSHCAKVNLTAFSFQGNHGLLCAVCDYNHGKVRSGKCIKCGAKTKHIFFFLMIVLWTTLLALFLLRSTIFVNYTETSKTNRQSQRKDRYIHETESLKGVEKGIEERNSVRIMQVLGISVNGGRMQSGPLQDMKMEVEMREIEEKGREDNEETDLKRCLSRSFVSDTFKVRLPPKYYNCICSEEKAVYLNLEMGALFASSFCF